MDFLFQPILENELVYIRPLRQSDFDALYCIASDPLVWEQHPYKDRWQHHNFVVFFEEALQSRGALTIVEKHTDNIIGCTRFYEFDHGNQNIFIGHTFYNRQYWGRGFNLSVKLLMLDYIFQHVEVVTFRIGATNLRSQIAIGRIGAIPSGHEFMIDRYNNEQSYFIYKCTRPAWSNYREDVLRTLGNLVRFETLL
jgi:N-acetyltransferase